MKYSLASRELIADCVETMLRAHCFDGMVCIPNCDKIVPGMMMAAARVNIPTVFVSGGPMKAGKLPSPAKPSTSPPSSKASAPTSAGKMTLAATHRTRTTRLPHLRLLLRHVHRQLHELPLRSPRPGPPRQRLHPRHRPRPRPPLRSRRRRHRQPRRQEHPPLRHPHPRRLRKRHRPRHGHGRLHQHRPAHPRRRHRSRRPLHHGAPQRIAARVPHICKVAPSGKYHMEDVDRAGGISAILKTIARKSPARFHLDLHDRHRQNPRRKHRRRHRQRHRRHPPPRKRLLARTAAWPSSSATSPPTARSSRPPASPPA